MCKYETKMKEIKEQIMHAGLRNVNKVTNIRNHVSQCRKMHQARAVFASVYQQAGAGS
jgi:hypothetical protein